MKKYLFLFLICIACMFISCNLENPKRAAKINKSKDVDLSFMGISLGSLFSEIDTTQFSDIEYLEYTESYIDGMLFQSKLYYSDSLYFDLFCEVSSYKDTVYKIEYTCDYHHLEGVLNDEGYGFITCYEYILDVLMEEYGEPSENIMDDYKWIFNNCTIKTEKLTRTEEETVIGKYGFEKKYNTIDVGGGIVYYNQVIENRVKKLDLSYRKVSKTTNTICDSVFLAAAKEAGQAKYECYKKDAASVENCIRALISAKYAQYQDNDEFIKALNAEFKNCIIGNATSTLKIDRDKVIKEGAKALSASKK